MFSAAEKKQIAGEIEKTLLRLGHPEMPKEKPVFKIHVDDKELWSWADIEPNWKYGDSNPPSVNPWNEIARGEMAKKDNKPLRS